jgi:localization factor PodJL
MDPPAPHTEALTQAPVLNRLTAQFDRLRADASEEAPSLAQLLERRLAAKKAREAAAAAPPEAIADVAPSTSEAPTVNTQISASLNAAIADIIARQHSLDEAPVASGARAAATTGPDAVDMYFGFEAPAPAVEEPAAATTEEDSAAATAAALRLFFGDPEEEAAPASVPAEPAVEIETAPAAEVEVDAIDEEPVGAIVATDFPASPSFLVMEAALERLVSQFEKTASRGFETLESCHSEILRTIRDSRSLSIEAAEAAAARTLDSSLGAIGGPLADRVEEIARGISELKAESSDSDRRTCDMLQAVRETLEIVAARLPQREATFPGERTQPDGFPETRLVAEPAAPERSRFIAAARRSAGSERAPDLRAVEHSPASDTAPEAVTARPRMAARAQMVTSSAQARFRKRLMIGAAAATLLLGAFGAATAVLNHTLAPDDTAHAATGTGEVATSPNSANFNTAEAGLPSSYRPTEPVALDTVPSLSSDIMLAPQSEVQDPAEPTFTGSIPQTPAPGVSAEDLPAEIGGPPLRRRVASGDPAALYEAGLRLAEGRGVARDPAKAAALLQRAASTGLAPAQYLLGSLKEKGSGVTKDIQAARQLYEQAAASGNRQAMHNIGVLLAEGGLGQPDMAGAADWFARAADLGLKDSQYNLGVIAARGLNGKPDLVTSYMWFALAAKQGDKDAASKRDQTGAKLTPAQLSAAKQNLAQWEPLPMIASANEVAAPPEGWDATELGRASTNEKARVIR